MIASILGTPSPSFLLLLCLPLHLPPLSLPPMVTSCLVSSSPVEKPSRQGIPVSTASQRGSLDLLAASWLELDSDSPSVHPWTNFSLWRHLSCHFVREPVLSHAGIPKTQTTRQHTCVFQPLGFGISCYLEIETIQLETPRDPGCSEAP